MLGPSAAQMAAAATAAAAAMSATAGTVLADGAPPVPRSVLGETPHPPPPPALYSLSGSIFCQVCCLAALTQSSTIQAPGLGPYLERPT